MAKKKVAPPPPPPSAVDVPAEVQHRAKLDNLKSLNDLLVKETMEKREHVKLLRSQLDDRSLSSALQESVVLTAVAAQVAFFRDEVARDLESRLVEKGSLCRSLEDARTAHEQAKAGVDEMEEKVRQLEEALGRERMERRALSDEIKEQGEAFQMLLLEKGLLVEDLKRESEEILESVRSEFLSNISRLKEDAEFLRADGNVKSKKVHDLEKMNKDLGGEVERLSAIIFELKEHINLMSQESEATNSRVSQLERMKGELEDEVKSLVSSLEDVLTEDIVLLKLEEHGEDLVKIAADLSPQVEDCIASSRDFRQAIYQQSILILSLERQLNDVVRGKKEIEHLNGKQQGRIGVLEEEVGELNSIIASLKKSCSEQAETITVMQSKSNSLREILDHQIEIATACTCRIESLQKSRDDDQQEIGKLRATLENITIEKTENERNLRSLLEDKALVDENLANARERLEDLLRKLKSAKKLSEGALSKLRSTVNGIQDKKDGGNGFAVDDEIDASEQEELQPFVTELEAFKKAYKLKAEEVEVARREACVLRDTIDDAKRRSGFWAWVSSASTVVAAVSVAYAAKSH